MHATDISNPCTSGKHHARTVVFAQQGLDAFLFLGAADERQVGVSVKTVARRGSRRPRFTSEYHLVTAEHGWHVVETRRTRYTQYSKHRITAQPL
jgi:hypothetical protein